jgi:hypothetical protein
MATTPKNQDISTASQKIRVLARLRRGPLTTLTARRELDVLHPAARIQALREDGHDIRTHWRTEETRQGRPHRVAEYVLLTRA